MPPPVGLWDHGLLGMGHRRASSQADLGQRALRPRSLSAVPDFRALPSEAFNAPLPFWAFLL
eukprot:3173840-Alexandrium_andersonii.AAC.1